MPTLLNNTRPSTSTVLASTTSSNMDDALVMASTSSSINNTKDALGDSSPPGAQADDNDVEIVGSPLVIEERPQEKRKSNDGGDGQQGGKQKHKSNDGGDVQQGKQKKKKHTATSKSHQKRPAISDADLEKQVNRARHCSLQNVVDLSLQDTQAPDSDGDDEAIKDVTTYFTMPISCSKQSLWWEGFDLFVPTKHPGLYKEYVMCKKCPTPAKSTDAGIVKVGVNQSTSNLRSHTRHHHPEEYETISTRVNKFTKRSSEQEVLPTSIKNMPGFSAKLKVKDARLLYRTAAATLAIEEGIPFRIFAQPSFRRLFTPLNSESDRIVNLNRQEVRDSVFEMGGFAIEATKREIRNHQIAWTSDHWTGADKGTYTTVTAHWINNATWRLHSACLDFKVFEGSTTGERIYEDIVAVLQKYQGESEDTIVFDTIGITDTTGNMGKLGRYLRENGKEHGYCTDHNLHLVAKLAFEREIVRVLMCFHLL
jgi:hypothetical protein